MKCSLVTAGALLSVCGILPGQAKAEESADPPPPARNRISNTVARALSPIIREYDHRIAELEQKLAELPLVSRSQHTDHFGFHTHPLDDQEQPQWVEIDLGQSYPIDSIAIVPVAIESPLAPDAGYGFPLRFLVEASETDEKDGFAVVADFTREDYPNPGHYPVLIRTPGLEGRHVRITITRHWPAFEHFISALGEVMVLSGNYNVAINRPVKTSSRGYYPPAWTPKNLTDGQSSLGPPTLPVNSPTNGWMSAPAEHQDDSKWLQVDLGEPMPVDEIRLIPARPTDMADVPGMGFPLRFRVEGSLEPDFETKNRRRIFDTDSLGYGYSNPGDDPVVFRSRGFPVRYVRMTAERLWKRGRDYFFALAELQAYADGKNVARDRPVSASDSVDDPESTRWAPEFAVDNFSSQHQLVELPEYLDLIDRRQQVSHELTALRDMRSNHADRVLTATAISSGASLFGIVSVLLFILIRQGRERSQETKRVREQIARDLHDDIGSNLGSITLISQIAAADEEIPGETREDFREIQKIAEATSESLRDIVWLIQTGEASLRDLVLRMRDTVHGLVGDLPHEISIRPEPLPEQALALQTRRHIFFAFKEALNNVRKHARASRVKIDFLITPKTLTFQVEDNGCGFDREEATRKLGNGLRNLQRRSERLGGVCTIDSQSDRGTTVRFSVPLK